MERAPPCEDIGLYLTYFPRAVRRIRPAGITALGEFALAHARSLLLFTQASSDNLSHVRHRQFFVLVFEMSYHAQLKKGHPTGL